MKTIVVDDEVILLEQFEYECGNISRLDIQGYFDDPFEALSFAKEHPVELAFIDIKMPGMDGFALTAKLRRLFPAIKVVAVTAYGEYGKQSPAEVMDAVLLKPYAGSDVEAALDRIL